MNVNMNNHKIEHSISENSSKVPGPVKKRGRISRRVQRQRIGRSRIVSIHDQQEPPPVISRSHSYDDILVERDRGVQEHQILCDRARTAAEKGELEVLKHIFQKDFTVCKVDQAGNTVLHVAAQNGQDVSLKWLLKHSNLPSNVKNGQDETCAHLAAQHGHLKALKAIIYAGLVKPITMACERDSIGGTVLHACARAGHDVMVTWLVDTFGKTLALVKDAEGRCALHYSAGNGHVRCVSAICKLGKNAANAVDQQGATPMIYAAQKGCAQSLQQLVNVGGGDIGLATKNGYTPLQVAVQSGNLEAVKFLLKRSEPCDLERQTSQGATVYHMAAGKGHVAVLTLLLQQDHAPLASRIRDVSGNSPAHSAADGGYTACLRLLHEQGINVHQKNRDGDTPYSLAVRSGTVECSLFARSLTGGDVLDPDTVEDRGEHSGNEKKKTVSNVLDIHALTNEEALNFKNRSRVKGSKSVWQRFRSPSKTKQSTAKDEEECLVQGEFYLTDALTNGRSEREQRTKGTNSTLLLKQKHRRAPVTLPFALPDANNNGHFTKRSPSSRPTSEMQYSLGEQPANRSKSAHSDARSVYGSRSLDERIYVNYDPGQNGEDSDLEEDYPIWNDLFQHDDVSPPLPPPRRQPRAPVRPPRRRSVSPGPRYSQPRRSRSSNVTRQGTIQSLPPPLPPQRRPKSKSPLRTLPIPTPQRSRSVSPIPPPVPYRRPSLSPVHSPASTRRHLSRMKQFEEENLRSQEEGRKVSPPVAPARRKHQKHASDPFSDAIYANVDDGNDVVDETLYANECIYSDIDQMEEGSRHDDVAPDAPPTPPPPPPKRLPSTILKKRIDRKTRTDSMHSRSKSLPNPGLPPPPAPPLPPIIAPQQRSEISLGDLIAQKSKLKKSGPPPRKPPRTNKQNKQNTQSGQTKVSGRIQLMKETLERKGIMNAYHSHVKREMSLSDDADCAGNTTCDDTNDKSTIKALAITQSGDKRKAPQRQPSRISNKSNKGIESNPNPNGERNPNDVPANLTFPSLNQATLNQSNSPVKNPAKLRRTPTMPADPTTTHNHHTTPQRFSYLGPALSSPQEPNPLFYVSPSTNSDEDLDSLPDDEAYFSSARSHDRQRSTSSHDEDEGEDDGAVSSGDESLPIHMTEDELNRLESTLQKRLEHVTLPSIHLRSVPQGERAYLSRPTSPEPPSELELFFKRRRQHTDWE